MQNYLHIGGSKDGLSFPVPDDAESVTWPVAVTDKYRSRPEHESRESNQILPAFRSGRCSARSPPHPTLQWERAEQKRRYNNLRPLTVPFFAVGARARLFSSHL